MTFNFINLNGQLRKLMLKEIENDIKANKLFMSKRFSRAGADLYPQLLKEAVTNGNEGTLAMNLKNNNSFKKIEYRQNKSGLSEIKVPITAPNTFAEGEFNRFYIRAICVKAIKNGIEQLIIYRGKEVNSPRIESQNKIGQSVNPNELLNDLRKNIGVDTALGLPQGPNSGLTVKL